MTSFYLWWVAEVGHPPIDERERYAFEMAQKAWVRGHTAEPDPPPLTDEEREILHVINEAGKPLTFTQIRDRLIGRQPRAPHHPVADITSLTDAQRHCVWIVGRFGSWDSQSKECQQECVELDLIEWHDGPQLTVAGDAVYRELVLQQTIKLR